MIPSFLPQISQVVRQLQHPQHRHEIEANQRQLVGTHHHPAGVDDFAGISFAVPIMTAGGDAGAPSK